MRILVSNDDGVFAPGIKCLADALSSLGQVTVVAPDRNRSGASNSLTLENPLRVSHVGERMMSVDGTPTDCVHLAITGLLDEEPDIVIAGINAGANMGDDVLYSGTVAAATEGRFMGYPAIAVSLVGDDLIHYESAAKAVICLVEQLKNDPLPADTILNVNVPNLPWDDIEGFEATRLGQRHRSEAVVKDLDPRGREIFWVGPAGAEQDAGPGTDFNAVRTKHVSVTPIHIDLTRYTAMDQVASWLQRIR